MCRGCGINHVDLSNGCPAAERLFPPLCACSTNICTVNKRETTGEPGPQKRAYWVGALTNSEQVTVTHCNGANPLRARSDPKLKAGDRNLQQRLQNSMGTAF